MAENETNGTDVLALLQGQLQSQQETINQLMEKIDISEENNHTNQVNLNSVGLRGHIEPIKQNYLRLSLEHTFHCLSHLAWYQISFVLNLNLRCS